jgi:hypothetical protein
LANAHVSVQLVSAVVLVFSMVMAAPNAALLCGEIV